MFLKIIYQNGREVLRECEEVTTVHMGDTEGGDYLQLSIDDGFPGAPTMTYIVPKVGSQVYFMNNTGGQSIVSLATSRGIMVALPLRKNRIKPLPAG